MINYSQYNLTIQQATRIYSDPEIPHDARIKREALGVLESAQQSYHNNLTKSESLGQLQNMLNQK